MFLWVQRKEQYKFRRDEEEMMWRTETLKHWWRLLLECGSWTRVGMRSSYIRNLYSSLIYCLTVACIYNIFWSASAFSPFLFSCHGSSTFVCFYYFDFMPTEFSQDHSHGHKYETWVTYQWLHNWRQWLLFCQHPIASLDP